MAAWSCCLGSDGRRQSVQLTSNSLRWAIDLDLIVTDAFAWFYKPYHFLKDNIKAFWRGSLSGKSSCNLARIKSHFLRVNHFLLDHVSPKPQFLVPTVRVDFSVLSELRKQHVHRLIIVPLWRVKLLPSFSSWHHSCCNSLDFSSAFASEKQQIPHSLLFVQSSSEVVTFMQKRSRIHAQQNVKCRSICAEKALTSVPKFTTSVK